MCRLREVHLTLSREYGYQESAREHAGEYTGMKNNIYLPHIATIKNVVEETKDTSTFTVGFDDGNLRSSFSYLPGQFRIYLTVSLGH